MKPNLKFIASVLGVLFAAGSLSASAAVSPIPQSSAAVLLQLGDQSVLVGALQALLIRQGYLTVAAPTGYFGARTKAAVIAFQNARGLTPTGIIAVPPNGATALFASASANPSFSPTGLGSRGSQVTNVQRSLIRLGFLHVNAPTGYFGALTKAAVMAFQDSRELAPTGMVDQATFDALNGN